MASSELLPSARRASGQRLTFLLMVGSLGNRGTLPWRPHRYARLTSPCKFPCSERYGSRMWKRIRMYKLRITQRCEHCRTRVTEEVHHRNGDAYDNRPSNLLALCKKCHSSITVKQR